jgi:hypothetical protein
LATIDLQSLYSCGFLGFSPTHSAWLSEADFVAARLLPEPALVGRACMEAPERVADTEFSLWSRAGISTTIVRRACASPKSESDW